MRPQSPSFLYLGSCQSPSPLKNTNLFYYPPKSCLEVFWETWIVWRSSQLILKEINPEYSLERLMLKLKFQYFRHMMWKADSLEKTLMVGKIEGRERRGWQRMRWLQGVDSMGMSLSKLYETVKDREAWRAAIHGITKSRTWFRDWTTATNPILLKKVSTDIWRRTLVTFVDRGGWLIQGPKLLLVYYRMKKFLIKQW